MRDRFIALATEVLRFLLHIIIKAKADWYMEPPGFNLLLTVSLTIHFRSQDNLQQEDPSG